MLLRGQTEISVKICFPKILLPCRPAENSSIGDQSYASGLPGPENGFGRSSRSKPGVSYQDIASQASSFNHTLRKRIFTSLFQPPLRFLLKAES
jgi:hypothetical protein